MHAEEAADLRDARECGLEEMTKGYYTAWLRLAAVGFVTVVGAGIWWVS